MTTKGATAIATEKAMLDLCSRKQCAAHCIYNSYMDVYSMLDGQSFVWDSDKAASNVSRHGVRFEQAREVFLDQLARYEDASPEQEARYACVGLTTDYRLLYVVHIVWEGCAPPDFRTCCGSGGKETL